MMFLFKLMPKRVLSLQARKPSGLIGRFFMGNFFNEINRDLNSFVEETLQLRSSHHVLEIGFGSGKLINRMASITTKGHIEGIDFSDAMFNEAIKNNKKHIASNSVKIQKTDCKKLNFNNESFDRVCSVNTIYFWNPPNVYLMEIFRVLKSGGQLVLVLFQLDIDGFSVHKMFRHKAQYADNGYSLGKCCNAVTEHLVIALRVSFSAPLAVLGFLPRE